jgi:hypothetical protein
VRREAFEMSSFNNDNSSILNPQSSSLQSPASPLQSQTLTIDDMPPSTCKV